MRILIVEDERALCDAIARSLRNLAYSVDCCHDGQEALDLLGVETLRPCRASTSISPVSTA